MSAKTTHPEILNQYRQALLTHFPRQIQRLILFGSQARDEATPESDIDVLVVVNWEEEPLGRGRYAAPFGDPRWRRMVELAYDLSLEYGVTLSPVVMSEKRFNRWSPLTHRIQREGIEVWTRN
jgi:predicted nucleotidyltransferase